MKKNKNKTNLTNDRPTVGTVPCSAEYILDGEELTEASRDSGTLNCRDPPQVPPRASSFSFLHFPTSPPL